MHRWVSYENAYDDLSSVEESERLSLLLVEWRAGGLSLSIDDLRRLFIYAWADGANHLDDDHHALAMLEFIAPVRDVESYLAGTLTIYGPAHHDADSIRWTLDEAVARQESRDGIVRGEVSSTDVLGHLMAGGKNHVLVNPDAVSGVEPV